MTESRVEHTVTDQDVQELLIALEDFWVTLIYRACLDDTYDDGTYSRMSDAISKMGMDDRIEIRAMAEQCREDGDFARSMVQIIPKKTP